MEKQQLREGWVLDFEGKKLSANIPFSVYYDLYRQGEIEDPFYRDNESQALPLSDQDYCYRLKFDALKEVYLCDSIYLLCEGVDTLADFYLNGVKAGEAFNMHRTWEFPVKGLLREKDNLLEAYFHSPTCYMEEQIRQYGAIPCNTDTLDGFPYLRKASHMSGWDWAPKLPDMGIFRNVSLLGVDKARICDVLIRQLHEADRVKLTFKINIHSMEEELTYHVKITDPNGMVKCYEQSPEMVIIENPLIWWPEASLYTTSGWKL